MKCTDCKYCLALDYGYSNWTVEGTSIDCLLKLNPSFPVDRGYGLEPSLDFAAKCPRYISGECISVDVDQEEGELENYSNDPEVKALLKEWETS